MLYAARRSMEQQSVLAQPEHLETEKVTSKYRWMRHFFTEDVSPDNRPIVELQQRAAWVGFAIVLQALNEVDHGLYFPYLGPVASLIPFALFLGSFYAMWMAFRPHYPKQQLASAQKHHPTRWQRIMLVMTLLATIAGTIEFGRTLVLCFSPPQYSNDGTSLDTNAAILLTKGQNPYVDSSLIEMARRFPILPIWTTPLRSGQFANRLDYPGEVEMRTVLDTDLKAGSAPEFESKVSYPSLSFLTLVPFVLANDYNVLPFYLLSYLALVAIAWKAARHELRPWILLLTMANVPMWSSTVGGNLDIFYVLLIVLAWLQRERRWNSALFLGLAVASKQIAWFFMPFYAIMTLRHYGLKETIYRLSVAGVIGLAFNLPFILWNPHAWLAGVLAPVADPMFPMGVGIINLSVTHLLPFMPESVYKVLELAAIGLSLVWYWRICPKRPEAAMLLAVLPNFVAWRSLPSYFYCAAYPLYVLMAARVAPGVRAHAGNPSYRLLPSLASSRTVRGLGQPASLWQLVARPLEPTYQEQAGHTNGATQTLVLDSSRTSWYNRHNN